MSGTKEVRIRACRTTTVTCKKCKVPVDKRETLLCLKCNSRYHFDCAGHSEKLAKLSGQKNFTCRICIQIINKQQKVMKKALPPPKSTSTPSASPPSNSLPLTSKPPACDHKDSIPFTVNVPTGNSFDTLSSDDDDDENFNGIEGDTATNLKCLNRSCPVKSVQMSSADVDELNEKILKLETQLKTNDKLYRDLLIENGNLKQTVIECETKIQRLTRICKSTGKKPKKDNTNKHQINFSLQTKQLHFPEEEYQSDTEFIKAINDSKDSSLNQTSIPSNSTSEPIPCNSPERKSKILIIADEQGQGVQHSLQKLMGSDCEVCCVWKSGADFGEVVGTCKLDISNLTSTDYLIVLAGLNDSNPFNLKLTLLKWLGSLSNTNVIVAGLPNNANLRYSTINFEIRLVCEAFQHCRYLRVNYRQEKFGSRFFASNLSFAIAREIVQLSLSSLNHITSMDRPPRNCTNHASPIDPILANSSPANSIPQTLLAPNLMTPSTGIKSTNTKFFRE
ncbi:hypothetical protein O0L34_g11021 [Tuta absoluta]|nr:hypothetical protein O0L34_g11021 [Tuta absoluta]